MKTAAGSRSTHGALQGSSVALWRGLASSLLAVVLVLGGGCAVSGTCGKASAPSCRNLPSDLEILKPASVQAPGKAPVEDDVVLNVYSASSPSLPGSARSGRSPASRGKGPLIAVIDLDSGTLGTSELRAVGNAIHSQLARDAEVGLLPQTGVRGLLQHLGILPHDPYGPPPAPLDIAKALRADFLIMGELNRVGGAYSLRTQLYSASKNDVVQTDSRISQRGLSELAGQLPALAKKFKQKIVPPGKTGKPPAVIPKPVAQKDTPGKSKYPPRPSPVSETVPAQMQQELGALQDQVRKLQNNLNKQIQLTQTHKEQADQDRAKLEELKAELQAEKKGRERAAEQTSMRTKANIAKAARFAHEANDESLPLDQVVSKLKLSVILDPTVAEYHIDLAKTLYATGAFDAAIEACGFGIGHHPHDATLRIVKGACYFSKADEIVKSRPRSDSMAMKEAQDLFAMAEQAYQQALIAEPDNAYAQYNLALTIQTSDVDNTRIIQSLREWDRYFAIAPADPEQAEWIEMAREIIKPLKTASP